MRKYEEDSQLELDSFLDDAKICVENAEAQLAEEREYLREIKEEFAIRACPFKIGEIVSSSGKRRTQIFKVLKILPGNWTLGYGLRVINIKRDGREGNRVRELYFWEIEDILKERNNG